MDQPFAQPPKSRKVLPYVIAAILIGGLATFALVSVAAFVFIRDVAAVAQSKAEAQAAPKFTDKDWGEREIGEISMEAPCTFGPGPNVSGDLPAEVKAVIDSMATFQGLSLPESFIVMVSRVVYNGRVTASLEGAVKGTVTEAAARLGDFNPKFDVQTITVSGTEGRRSLYKHAVGKETMYLETLTVCKANRLWQVQVIYAHEESGDDADRIIESVEIEY